MHKLFDLRFVIGSFFLVIGILLFGYSFFAKGDEAINHFCGIAFMLFGIIMIFFSLRKTSR